MKKSLSLLFFIFTAFTSVFGQQIEVHRKVVGYGNMKLGISVALRGIEPEEIEFRLNDSLVFLDETGHIPIDFRYACIPQKRFQLSVLSPDTQFVKSVHLEKATVTPTIFNRTLIGPYSYRAIEAGLKYVQVFYFSPYISCTDGLFRTVQYNLEIFRLGQSIYEGTQYRDSTQILEDIQLYPGDLIVVDSLVFKVSSVPDNESLYQVTNNPLYLLAQ